MSNQAQSPPPKVPKSGAGEAAPGRSAGPMSWCLLAAVLFGASTPASKPLLQHFSPLLLSGLLYLGAALAVAPWALRGLGTIRRTNRRSAWRLAGAVFFGGIVGPVLLLTGLSMANAASVALWLNLETVATAFLARYFFKEHLGKRTWVAVALIVIASVSLSGFSPGAVVPGLLVGLACLAWGFDNNLTAVIDEFTPAQITFAKGLIAGVLNTAAGLTLQAGTFELAWVGPALGIGALAYGASILFYVAGAQQLGATRSQLIFSTAPVWGIALAWTALGEPIEGAQIVAAALMAVAIWLWQSERHAHAHVHREMSHTHWHQHDDGHHVHGHQDAVDRTSWHSHEHKHQPTKHSHEHQPDLHHRHEH